jgi:signal transduction histidine kinase
VGSDRLSGLAQEQAALRRVATLVARGAAPEEVFSAVAKEAGLLLGVEDAHLCRYETDGTVTVVAASGSDAVLPVGSRWRLGGDNVVTTVHETGRPARVANYAGATGPIAVAARERGARTSVGTPVVVERRLWGVVVAGSASEQRLPADIQPRLGSFTELVAAAIANAESRTSLRRLAEEQAALRRVATLVARGVPPEEVFAAVTAEVGQLLGAESTGLGRYDADGLVTVVAASGTAVASLPVGSRWDRAGTNLVSTVFETGRPARNDGGAKRAGPVVAAAREAGVRSSVGSPIVVEGHLWGLVIAGSTEPLPPDSEARLADFTALVAMAIANAQSRAELAASRARIVAAADESRRRIERDLHDGAQQRIVHAVIVLKLAVRALSRGHADAGELVAEAMQHVEQANSELRQLAHGIVPSALADGGLRAGVLALASKAGLPVSVDVSVERLPASVEATAYFVVSEALTNVVKHAHAGGASVTAQVKHGELQVEIRDDGAGGARGGARTGLGGLEDRVSALDGRLVVESPPGRGTRVCAVLPVVPVAHQA